MSDTTQIVEQAIAKQEAEDAGIDTSGNDDKKGANDDKGDDTAGKPGIGGDDSKAGDKGAADDSKKGDDNKKADDKPGTDTDKKEGEFTADDALEVDEKPAEPSAPTDNAGIQLSPLEQKFIADNIGEPIVIRGWRGEGDNAKEVEIKAYSPSDIPADFKFANDQQLAAAGTGFQALERKANELLGNFRQNQSNAQAQDYEKRENEGIKADVADLQKEGKFPKFTVRPGAPGFDDSPEAKQMAEVLEIMGERNQLYMQQYQQGRPFKHIGFAEAFDLWEAKNPATQERKKADVTQKKEDEERKHGAERGDTNRGTSPTNIVKPTVKHGTTTRDILARIDSME